MTLFRPVRRAALLGFIAIAACDVYAVATDPFPGLVQTWNLPVTSTAISVASLLPTGVSICCVVGGVNDSSAFTVQVNNIAYSRTLGPYCPACQAVNGTNAPKPAFTISPDTGSTANLPTNVDSATVLGGLVDYQITNNFTFDPIRVSANLANPQGRIVVLVRSGSVVLGRDTVKGENQTFPAGTVLTRQINMQTGPIASTITVDMEVFSPAGDVAFINASRTLGATATVSSLRVGQVKIRVPGATLSSGTPESLPTDQLEESLKNRAIGGGMELTVTNPFAVSGNVSVQFTAAPGLPINKPAPLAALTTPQVLPVALDSAEMSQVLNGAPTTFALTGGVSSAVPITVTPKQAISVSNRLVLIIRAFGGK